MKTKGNIYHNDRLVFRVQFEDGTIASQGKRVPKNCPIPEHIRKIYVKSGFVKAIRALMDTGLSLSESKYILECFLKYK